MWNNSLSIINVCMQQNKRQYTSLEESAQPHEVLLGHGQSHSTILSHRISMYFTDSHLVFYWNYTWCTKYPGGYISRKHKVTIKMARGSHSLALNQITFYIQLLQIYGSIIHRTRRTSTTIINCCNEDILHRSHDKNPVNLNSFQLCNQYCTSIFLSYVRESIKVDYYGRYFKTKILKGQSQLMMIVFNGSPI